MAVLMQVQIDGGSIGFPVDYVLDLGGGDEIVGFVVDADGAVVAAQGVGSTLDIRPATTPPGGTGRPLWNIKNTPTATAGFVAGHLYSVAIETWDPPSTSKGWRRFGPFQVVAAGSATPASFTVTDSAVGANDTVRVCQKSGTDKYQILVTAVAAGSFEITFFTTGGTTTEQPVFNFSVIKGATSDASDVLGRIGFGSELRLAA
jgi:hypothetical protein